MISLKNHPFAIESFFESSIVLTFAVPKNQLQCFIPECFQLDLFQNQWAFMAVALVQTKNLRPKGFPKALGNDFFLIGYRIFVRYKNNQGKNLRGLYIIKSETDKKRMNFLGNLFTQYNYTTTDIVTTYNGKIKSIHSNKSKFQVTINETNDSINIPKGSPFTDWKDARRFSGPLPFTFSFNQKDNTVLIVEGVRENWIPVPIQIDNYSFDFLNSMNFNDIVLANAFEINNISYSWKKGRIEKWI